MERTIEGSCSRLQEPELPHGFWCSPFRFHVISLWGRALRRRSQKDGTTWKRILKIADEFIPKPRILHPWPNQRFAVKYSK